MQATRIRPLLIATILVAPLSCDNNAAKEPAKLAEAAPSPTPTSQQAKPVAKPDSEARAEAAAQPEAAAAPDEAAAEPQPDAAAKAEPAAAKAEPAPEKPEQADRAKPAAAAKQKKPAVDPAVAKIDAKAIYAKKCKNCHGANGDADTKLGKKYDVETWHEKGWRSRWTLAKVTNIVKNGKSDTKMKSFAKKLTPDEITAVAMYSRTLGK